MTDHHLNDDADNVLSGLSPELSRLIGDAPPPPVGGGSSPFVGGSSPFFGGSLSDEMPQKVAKAAERSLNKEADRFAGGLVDKQHLRKFGAIAQMVPGAARIRVRKRRDGGGLSYVNEFNFRDLEAVGDTEAFVAKFCVPKFGPGEYAVTIIDAQQREHQCGSIFIEGLPLDNNGGGNGMTDLIRDLTNRLTSPQQQAPAQDPIRAMREAAQFAKELKQDGGGGDSSAMLMAMMMRPQAPTGPDPMVIAALERIAAKVEKLEGGGGGAPMNLPPLPPPAPSIDWVAVGTGLILPAVQMMMQNAANNQQMMLSLMTNKDSMSTKDMIQMMQTSQLQAAQLAGADKLTMKDVIELVTRQNDATKPAATLKDQMEAVLEFQEMAKAISPPAAPGPQGASFWDALVALASSGDVAGAISDRIRTKNEAAQGQQQTRALPERSGATVIPFPQQGRQQAAPPAQEAPQRPAVPIPVGLAEHAQKITAATDAGDRVQRVVETLIHLHRDAYFKPFDMQLLETVAKGEKEGALRGLGNWLSLISNQGMLTKETALQVLHDFNENWDLIRELLVQKIPFLTALAAKSEPVQTASAPAETQVVQAPAQSVQTAPPGSDPEVPSDIEMPPGYGDENEVPAHHG